MASKKNDPEKDGSFVSSTAGKAFDILSALRLFFVEIRQNFLERWDFFLRRVEYLLMVYLWISAGMLLGILGIFYLLIDYAQAPRGVVFSLGGLIILLTAVIFLQAAKIKKSKR
jgi:hypothetical protein